MPIGLSSEQLTHFTNHGYLAIPDVLAEADLAPVEAEYDAVLGRAADEL